MGAAPLSWLAKIGGDTLKTKAKLLSSAINELYDDGFKKRDIVGLDYIKAATADDLKNKVPEATAVKELNSNLKVISDYITSDYSNNPIAYSCNGFMAMIHINGLKNINKDESVIICNLPECARPTGIKVVDISNADGAVVRLFIQANGNVIVYNYTDKITSNIVHTFTYLK